jgi:phospholipid/cholesterol/gamma-HCH transport system substrate-binding protein
VEEGQPVTRVRHTERLPNWVIGLVVVTVIAFATILAFSGLLGLRMPWQGGFEVKAVFASAQNIRQDSPVRIAGVNVGTVTGVEHLNGSEAELTAQVGEDGVVTDGEPTGQPAAVVTMDLTDDALPIKEDAQFKLRPRLFLEGNYFVDLQPGSPAANEIDEGFVFPVNQTSYSAQLDQILTTLQSDVRQNLKVFLHEFGNALIKHGGAEGFREYFASSAAANKFTSQVNEAVLGTEPDDLGGLIKGLDRVVRGLGRNEQTLQDLVTNFRIFSGSFAAEDVALGQAIERLPAVLRSADPAFANLNASFPPLRAFAREALPGVRSTPETLRAATPFIGQVRALVSKRELRGLVADLRPTIPALADLAQESVGFMKQTRALSSCFNEVIIPWSHDSVEPVDPAGVYPHGPVGRVFEETGYVLTGLTAIGRNGDANGQWARVLGQSGPNLVEFPGADNEPSFFGLVPFELLGSMPGKGSSAKTVFTAEHPCERQEPPSLQANRGTAPQQTQLPLSALSAVEPDGLARAAERLGLVGGGREGESGGGS